MLEPGKQVKVRLLKSRDFCKTFVLVVDEKTFTLAFPFVPRLKLVPGDEVEVEVPLREDNSFILQADVLDVARDQVTLHKRSELISRGHRSSERIDAIFEAEYVLLAQKRFEGTFREGQVLNISQTGALLAVKEPLNLNEDLLLLFEIALSTLTVNRILPTVVKGEVVREHPGAERDKTKSYSYGIKFEKPFNVLSR